MILISVKSEVMDTKRQFETDKAAEKYLLFVKKYHDDSRKQKLGRRPLCLSKRQKAEAGQWDKELRTLIPLKIEIINTEANQLCIPELLIQSRIIK